MKRLVFLLVLLFLLFNNMSSMVSQAQCRSDRDGDGVCDTADRCPSEAGPASNNGCPRPATDTDRDDDGIRNSDDRCPDTAGRSEFNGCPPPDADGDGTPDSQDRCPNEGGPASNAGCPEGQAGTEPVDPCVSITASPNCNPNPNNSQPLPDLPSDGRCVLGTRYADRVNVRLRPSTQAEIVAQLDPNAIVPVLEVLETFDGRWYRIVQGWVFGEVIRLGGNCQPDKPEGSALVDCPSLVALSPVETTVGGQVLFTWTSPSAEVPVAFYQISLYDAEGNWLYDAWSLEPSTEVLIDLSAVNVGAIFQWNVIALDWDENPLCESAHVFATTGVNPNDIGANPICADFVGIAPLSELGNYSTDFSWTTLADVPYYHVKLFNSAMETVADAFTIAAGATSGYSFITNPELIGAGDAWYWQVDGHWSNMSIACTTPLYPIVRAQNTGMTPSQPNPEGLCDAFALLSPETETSVPDYQDLVELNWSPIAQPVLMAYMVFAGPVGGPMELQVTTPDTTATLDLTKFEGLSDIQWQVKALSASALAGAACESAIYYLNIAEAGEVGGNAGGGLVFPNIDIDIIRNWACPQVQVLIFSDSVESSYFQWAGIPAATAYRLNLYDANDNLVSSHDMDSFVEVLVMQVPFGAQDEWSFDLQVMLEHQVLLCTSQRYYVERDFQPSAEIGIVTLDIEAHCEVEALSPLDSFGDGIFTNFEWSSVENAGMYNVVIYNSNDEVVKWYTSYADEAATPEDLLPTTRTYETDVAHIGAGTEFSWEIQALTAEGGCVSQRVPVTRLANPFTFLPDIDINFWQLELAECAGFAPVAPLDFLGTGLFTYFEWTDLPEAEHYDLKIYNADNVLVHWSYVPTDHSSSTKVAAYYTNQAAIGAGINFSWEVIATLDNGLACTSPRLNVARQFVLPPLPLITVWDLENQGDDAFIDPNQFGEGDACADFPTDQIPTDQRGRFLNDFCEQGRGGAGDEVMDLPTAVENGGGDVGDPFSECGAIGINPEEGFVDVLELVGAVDMFRTGGIYESLNFCNPAGDGLLLPAVRPMAYNLLFFLDAEAAGYEKAGTLVLVIIIEPSPDGKGFMPAFMLDGAGFMPAFMHDSEDSFMPAFMRDGDGFMPAFMLDDEEAFVPAFMHEVLFIPADSALTNAQIQQIIEDGLADPPSELTDGTLGYLIGLLHDAGLESVDDGALNFANVQNILLGAGGLNPNVVFGIVNAMMH